jgi:hypothetical protein
MPQGAELSIGSRSGLDFTQSLGTETGNLKMSEMTVLSRSIVPFTELEPKLWKK